MNELSLKNIGDWPPALRITLIAVSCIAVFYLFYFFDISALNIQYTAQQQTTQDINAQLTAVMHKQMAIQKETQDFDELQKLFNQWQQQIIQQKRVPDLINNLLKIGADNNLHFNSFTPDTESKVNLYTKTSIKIIAVGSYHQLGDFISQVANMPFVVSIDHFSISSENKDSTATDGKLLTAEFDMEVYSLAETNISH